MILSEFCRNTGYNRKYGIRLLNGPPPNAKRERSGRRGRAPTYSAAVISIRGGVWEAAGLPVRGAPEGFAAPVDALGAKALGHAEDQRTENSIYKPRLVGAARSLEQRENGSVATGASQGRRRKRALRDGLLHTR